MPVAAWILALVGPLAIRVIVALGFGIVSFAGVTVAFQGLLSFAQSSWSALPASVLSIASLSGIPECLGLIAGAYSARLAVWAAMNGTKYILKG